MLGRLRKGAALLLGRSVRVGRFSLKLVRVIGEGGFGFVYEAADETQSYAVKKLICQTKEQADMARHEFEMMKKLSFCSACAPLLDMSETTEGGNTVIYGVMPLYKCCVNDLVLKGKLPEPFLLGVMARIVEALHAVHSLGYVHLDVKSTNFFLKIPQEAMDNVSLLNATHAATCVLGDYGSCELLNVAKGELRTNSQLRERLKSELQAKTTPGFRSPEIVDMYGGLAISGVSDTFSLGVALYQMAYNKLAFDTDGAASNCRYKIPFEFGEIYNAENASKPFIQKGDMKLTMGGRDPYLVESELRDRGIPFDDRKGPAYSPHVVHLIHRMLVRNNDPTVVAECRASLVEIADYLNGIGIKCNLDKSLNVDEFAQHTGFKSPVPNQKRSSTNPSSNSSNGKNKASNEKVSSAGSEVTSIFDILGSPSSNNSKHSFIDAPQQQSGQGLNSSHSALFPDPISTTTDVVTQQHAPQQKQPKQEWEANGPGPSSINDHYRTQSGTFSFDDWMSDVKLSAGQPLKPITSTTSVTNTNTTLDNNSLFDVFRTSNNQQNQQSQQNQQGNSGTSQQDTLSQFEFAVADSFTFTTASTTNTVPNAGKSTVLENPITTMSPGLKGNKNGAQPIDLLLGMGLSSQQVDNSTNSDKAKGGAKNNEKLGSLLGDASLSDAEGDFSVNAKYNNIIGDIGIRTTITQKPPYQAAPSDNTKELFDVIGETDTRSAYVSNVGANTDIISGNLIELDFSGTGLSTAEPTEDIIQNLEKTKHNVKIKQFQSESDSLADVVSSKDNNYRRQISDEMEENKMLGSSPSADRKLDIDMDKDRDGDGDRAGNCGDENGPVEDGSLSSGYSVPSVVSESQMEMATTSKRMDGFCKSVLSSTITSMPPSSVAPFVYSPHSEAVLNRLLSSVPKEMSLSPATASLLNATILLLLTEKTSLDTLKAVRQYVSSGTPGAMPKLFEVLKETVQTLLLTHDNKVSDLKVLGSTARLIKSIIDPMYSMTGVIPANYKTTTDLHTLNFLFDLARRTQEATKDQHMIFSVSGRLDVEYSRFRTLIGKAEPATPDVADVAGVPVLPVTRLEKELR